LPRIEKGKEYGNLKSRNQGKRGIAVVERTPRTRVLRGNKREGKPAEQSRKIGVSKALKRSDE